MASERQVEANRRNALRSTGPRTFVGKLVSARNALRHGILAGDPVLPDVERAEEWERHKNGIVSSLGPVGLLEARLAERVAELLWRMGRVARYESVMVAVRLDEAADVLAANDLADRDGGGVSRVAGCRAELARAEQTVLSLAGLEELGDEVAVAAKEVREIFDVMANLVCPVEMHRYATDPSFWAALELPGKPVFDDVAWSAALVRKGLRLFAGRGQIEVVDLARRALKLAEARVARLRRELPALEAAEQARQAALEVAVEREQVRRLLPDAATAERLQRYESHLNRQLVQMLEELQRLRALRVRAGVRAGGRGGRARQLRAQLAQIGFLSQSGPAGG